MIAAFEQIGQGKLVWAVEKTAHEARILASRRATEFHQEKVPAVYFDVCDAQAGWEAKCGADVKDWETVLV